MQQELIEMLDKMVKYFDEIPSDSYYYRETGAILNEAEKLVEKAKNSAKEPAVPQGLPLHRCTNCQAIYQDQPPTQCDCMPDKQEYQVGFASFPKTPAAPSQPVTCGNGCSCLVQCGDTYAYAGLPSPKEPVTLTDDELEECFRRAHEETNTAYVPIARFPIGWRLYGRQVIAALREKEQAK